MVPYILSKDRVCVFVGGKPETLTQADQRFAGLLEALRSNATEEEIQSYLANNKTAFVKEAEFVDLPPALDKRVAYLKENGMSLEPIRKFIENLKKNPSEDSRRDLYGFLEACDLPVTEDGCFLAYKRVNAQFRDLHTNTFDNSVGKVVEMPREDVDPNREETCSQGLHVCSKDYLSSFGGQNTIVVKVNPADVVAVPVDYNNAKMRVCRYEVIGIIQPEEGEIIKPMAVVKNKKKKTVPKAAAKARAVMNELNKAEKFDKYVKDRNLPKSITRMSKSQKQALRKFAARLLYGGSHAAGEKINSCKTLAELKKVVCG